ncbi:hypothetical protein MFIFM68171_09132 [Madurella fahalii]|uniref:Pentatricopeptide repeat-containing protein-mitochondrial domain-containing protein n=1 Tax=Madurella fahalii TaxID=1157608 RepID=A0ABQ0GMD7_9PEZI
MASNRVMVDVLWRCLNPSIDAKSLAKAIKSPFPLARRVRTSRHPDLCRSRHGDQIRALHAAGSLLEAVAQQSSADAAKQQPVDPSSKPQSGPTPNTISELLESDAAPLSTLRRFTTPVLYETLRALRNHHGQGSKIRQLVEYLVAERGEQPNVFLYEALVTANWDTATGSAGELADVMKEMQTAGLKPSTGFYHSALRLLAIHPDYLTRNSILSDMEAQAMELRDEGKCSVALGLLRDTQVEMALEYLDQMCRDGVDVPDWLFSIFFYTLGRQGFLDETLQLLHQRLGSAEGSVASVPLAAWHFLLEEFSSALHYEGARFVWETMVQPGILNPSDGIALYVLNTASRHGDSALATQVIQLLSSRRVKLGVHHYEALLDCYVEVGELGSAFEVLHIMMEAGIQPDQASTRSIFLALKDSPELLHDALGILSESRKQHGVPISAVNVLLEALAQSGDMPKALDVYRQLGELCPSGPNQQTFVVLLQGAKDEATKDFLASEMQRVFIRLPHRMLDPEGQPFHR